MSFKYSVIGDNTIENREHLEKLGYKPSKYHHLDKEYLFTSNNDILGCTYRSFSIYSIWVYSSLDILFGTKIINCIGNHELFKAVSAIRDDNHIHQWHIIDYDVYLDMPKGYWFIATDLSGCKHVGCQIDPMYCRKATLLELQLHFKRV